MEKKYRLKATKTALKDYENLSREHREKADKIFSILESNPYQNPPPFEKLYGEIEGMFSRRINRIHRVVYEIHPSDDESYAGIVVIVRAGTHYRGMMSLMF